MAKRTSRSGRTPTEFIREATQNQVECRVMRHAWDVNKGTVEREGRHLKWVMPCMRDCGTKKVITIKTNGELVRASYRWAKDYHVKGGLRKVHLNALRKVLLEEMLG